MDRTNQKLLALAALWEGRCKGEALPARGDLPTSVLKPWLGSLALFDLRDAAGPVFRVCGTHLHVRFGGEMTGKAISNLAPDVAAALRRELEAAITTRKPHRIRQVFQMEQQLLVFHELYLPLADGGEGVGLVLLASYRETK